MAQRWKTFTPNSTLPASDVNDVLNPSTADHLARSVATGTANLSIAGGSNTTGFVSVSFPSGRFSSPPVVVATSGATTGNLASVSVYVSSITSTGFSLRVTADNTPSTSQSAPVRWIAVEM